MDPLRAQAAYYLATGVWPLVHLRSFMALTGRKQDTWLVQTFGALVAALGWALLPAPDGGGRAAQRRVGAAIALALAGCEVWFVTRRRIPPIYLADAALELWFAASLMAPGGKWPLSGRR